MSSTDDALDVARFIDRDARAATCRARHLSGESGDMLQRCSIAAAERVLVERGLGHHYGYALVYEMYGLDPGHLIFSTSMEHVASIRTAPLEVCLRALARVVREQQQKEKA